MWLGKKKIFLYYIERERERVVFEFFNLSPTVKRNLYRSIFKILTTVRSFMTQQSTYSPFTLRSTQKISPSLRLRFDRFPSLPHRPLLPGPTSGIVPHTPSPAISLKVRTLSIHYKVRKSLFLCVFFSQTLNSVFLGGYVLIVVVVDFLAVGGRFGGFVSSWRKRMLLQRVISNII